MPGTGDIGGGSCRVSFEVHEGAKVQVEKWECHDQLKPNERPLYRVVPKDTPNQPGAGWNTLKRDEVLQVRWGD